MYDRKFLPASVCIAHLFQPTTSVLRFQPRRVVQLLAIAVMAVVLPGSWASHQANFQQAGRGQREAEADTSPCPAAAISAERDPTASAKKAADDRPPAKFRRSTKPGNEPWRSRFSLSAKTSTLGLGADLGFRVAQPLNLRFGFGAFRYGRELSKDGVAYRGVLHLQSVEILGDWFPFRGSFHISPGVLLQDNNRVTALANPPVGQVLTAGEQNYVSDPQNPITGKASSGIHPVAPMLMIGFGNLVPRSRHFAYSIDFGAVYQGSPKSSFSVRGGACDPSGEFCANVAEDPSIQAEAQSARSEMNRRVSFMRFYPVISLEFGYRF